MLYGWHLTKLVFLKISLEIWMREVCAENIKCFNLQKYLAWQILTCQSELNF